MLLGIETYDSQHTGSHSTAMSKTSAAETRRYGQVVYLKAEYLEEYRKIHAAVWPEILAQIKDSNIRDCR